MNFYEMTRHIRDRTISYSEAVDILQELLDHMRQDEAMYLIETAYNRVIPLATEEHYRKLEEYRRLNLEHRRLDIEYKIKKLEPMMKYNPLTRETEIDIDHNGKYSPKITKKDFISKKEMEI